MPMFKGGISLGGHQWRIQVLIAEKQALPKMFRTRPLNPTETEPRYRMLSTNLPHAKLGTLFSTHT